MIPPRLKPLCLNWKQQPAVRKIFCHSISESVEAYATVGEISNRLRKVWRNTNKARPTEPVNTTGDIHILKKKKKKKKKNFFSITYCSLRKKKLKILWGHRLQSLTANGVTLRAEIAKLDQVASGYPIARSEWVVVRTESIQPAYIIGADGYDSAVRRMAGIEMAEHGASQVFSVYEIEATGELPDEARVILDPDLTSVYWPLEEGRCRWGFQIKDVSEHAPSMERLEQLIAARAPWCTARPTQIYWSTLGVFEQRLTRSFGKDGVWLAGDAAHQAAPVGVQSMNSGLVEARELAARISRIRHAGESPSLLQEFATETHGTWQWLLGVGRTVRALPGTDPWVQQTASRILACIPASGADLEPLLQQIGLTAER